MYFFNRLIFALGGYHLVKAVSSSLFACESGNKEGHDGKIGIKGIRSAKERLRFPCGVERRVRVEHEEVKIVF